MTSITAIGLALPEFAISQTDAAQRSVVHSVASDRQRQLAPRLYQRSGVESRHSVVLRAGSNGDGIRHTFFSPPDDDKPFGPTTAERMGAYSDYAAPLALQACRQAIDDSQTTANSVTHLVTVSCSGFEAPGVDIALIEQLGLSPQVSRSHVGFMGCHGALNGLRVAEAYAEASPDAVVLLLAVELCSLHYQYAWTNENLVSNALFADGAAAAIVTSGHNARAKWTLGAGYAEIVSDSLDAMTWRIGDNGFAMTLSNRVPEIIHRELPRSIDSWLEREGLSRDQVAGWAIHPGGPRIVQACRDALGLAEEQLSASYEVLRRYGNMSSPTVLFVLDRLRQSGVAGPTVALGFGPGLAIEARLLHAAPTEPSPG